MPTSCCKTHFLATCLLLFTCVLNGQNKAQRAAERVATLGMERSYFYDSYLSESSYSAPGLVLEYGSEREAGINHRFLTHAAYTKTPSDFNLIQMALIHRAAWIFPRIQTTSVRVGLGPSLQTQLGGRYTTQNRNNPGSLDALIQLGIQLKGQYRFTLHSLPIRISYTGEAYLLGLQFAPEYQQSYYELFSLGQYKQAFHGTSLHNQRLWNHQLSVDIPIGNKQTRLRISYCNEFRKSDIHHIRVHQIHDGIRLGIVFKKSPKP